jgi:hypothetical protein
MTTLLYKNLAPIIVSNSHIENEDLWLPLIQLSELGIEIKSSGVCFDDTCVPIPDREKKLLFHEKGTHFNITAFARRIAQPVLHHRPSDVWLIGESGDARTSALTSLQAPDFTLPDLDGRLHSLSDYRGKKVFLVSWASW